VTDKNRPSRFTRNAVANWTAFLFAAAVGFFLSPYVVEHLGPTRYGVWSLIAGLIGYLGLLDLGIRQGVSRYIARHHAVHAHEDGSLIVSAALKLFGFLGILAILFSGALALLAPILFNIPDAFVHDARIIIVLGGLTAAVTLIGGVFGGVLTGLERFDVHCGLEILVTSARTAAIVLALREGYGLVALALIHFASSILHCVVFRLAVRRLYGQLRIRLWGALGAQMRTILSFSATLTVIYGLDQVIYYSGTAVIGAFLPIESVTFFVIALSLCVYAKGLPKSLSYVMTPRISALTSAGSNRVGEEILAVARIATLVSAAIAVTFVFRGESFIRLWMGPAYGKLSGEVLRTLAVVVWLDASRSVVIQSLTGMAKQHMVIPGIAMEAAGNVALSLALVQPFGIAGVALGTSIPNVLVSLVYIPRCLSRATGVPASLFCRDAVLLPTLACLPFALATAMIERYMPAANLAVFFGEALLILPLIPVTAWFVCLSPEERERMKSRVGQMTLKNRYP
jgi:O-antigen/teichoic acid export membrane protein